MRCALVFLLLMLNLLTLSATPCQAVKLNTPAPDFTLKDLQGGRQALSGYRGKLVLLNFWSTTCPPCVQELPSLNDLYKDQRQAGLQVLGIALDPAEKPVRELAGKLRLEFPVVLDSNKDVYFDSYGLFGQPVSVIIDRTGLVREKMLGAVDWSSPQIRAKITSYLKGR
ncbi:TlpA family protein disulfide reductase [Trichlorobacter lovleyi]|uniref:peroxiredoxin family protein n=1 Tax=Trichlorobacter lovleyi TaxID=313985 RepID=UPI00223F69A6|nr:TlpA disulfide reductase family protein [Trichlorobacter lovleyi]QOX77754.1 TlpA family protein disulfide reductase [Trichlorobacter lovleyi]